MESAQTSKESRVAEAAARVTPQLDQAVQNLEDLNHRVVTFIKEQPATCLLAAAALGFVIGRIASR